MTIISSATFLFADESNSFLRPPVFSKNQFIFTSGRLTPGNDFIDRASDDAYLMPECGITNTLNDVKKINVDYESVACSLYYERNIQGFRTSINGGFLRTGGGVFDSSIESFHETFGFPNGDRGRTEENRYSAEGQGSVGDNFEISETDFSVIDPQISISIPLDSDSLFRKGMYLDLSSSIPLSSGRFSLDKPDLKATLSYASNYDSGYAYFLGTSALYHFDHEQNSVKYDPFAIGAFASVQFMVFDKFSFFVQNIISSNIEADFLGLHSYYWYADFGIRYPLSDSSVLEFIIRENPSPGSGTADVSLFVRAIF